MEILHVFHVFVRSLMFLLLWSKCEGRESELNHVTCGSLLKLLNTRHNVRLHSHDVKYGSGSGQQSVTGVEIADDANSYWQIRGKPNRPCQRGEAVNVEVSAFGENGEGDNLDVVMASTGREEDVRFKHVGTDVFLSVTGEQYGHPIRGQREVHGMSSANQNNWWRSMEGVFLQPSQMPLRHDEL
ncbi:hypothetical protein F7725_013405 [Dissostichus mawsoni]|uniref:MIR domain-containing protein n=1 Tax=Dissostichus mawsoni TaxID=36200 RepID=A0A7J5YR71_DISMA|nr:hypothetical protein F7725_013405 [Dissostichus mawsoni]